MSQQQAIAQAIDPVVDAIYAQSPAVSITGNTNSPTWYSIAKGDENEAEISIYDMIGGFGIKADQFARDLKAIKAKTVHVYINSQGGSVFDGVTIASAIKRMRARVVTHIDGIAASIASIVAIAGHEVHMAKNGFMMIHNPMMAGGITADGNELRKMADTLDKMRTQFANTYAERTGKTTEEMAKLMDDETWFSAEEARDIGFVDVITGEVKAAAAVDLSVFKNVPEAVAQLWSQPQINNELTKTEPPRGEAAPVIIVKETVDMAETNATVPPAQPAVAANQGIPQEISRLNEQTRQHLIENGKKLGIEEGRSLEFLRMQKLIEAAPGRPDLVIEAFVNRQEPGALALAVKAAQAASAAASQAAQERDLEIARLQSLLATGGHAGVSMQKAEDTAPQYDLEPEARAKMEWDSNPNIRAQFGNNERRYTLYRVNQLNGSVRVLKTA